MLHPETGCGPPREACPDMCHAGNGSWRSPGDGGNPATVPPCEECLHALERYWSSSLDGTVTALGSSCVNCPHLQGCVCELPRRRGGGSAPKRVHTTNSGRREPLLCPRGPLTGAPLPRRTEAYEWTVWQVSCHEKAPEGPQPVETSLVVHTKFL